MANSETAWAGMPTLVCQHCRKEFKPKESERKTRKAKCTHCGKVTR